MWQIKLPRSPGLKRPCFLLFLAWNVTTEISITFPFLSLSYCTHRSEVDTDKLTYGRYLTYMIWFRTKPPEERADSIGPSQGMWENASEMCSGVSAWVWTPSALPQPRRPSASAPWLRLLGSKSESHKVSSPINSLLQCLSQGLSIPEIQQKGINRHFNTVVYPSQLPHKIWQSRSRASFTLQWWRKGNATLCRNWPHSTDLSPKSTTEASQLKGSTTAH